MSDDENCTQSRRFNKFENSSSNLENAHHFYSKNTTLKRNHNNGSAYSDNVKKMCMRVTDSSTRLNQSWSEHSRSLNAPSPINTNYSANNRLKKLRFNLEASKLENISTPYVNNCINPKLTQINFEKDMLEASKTTTFLIENQTETINSRLMKNNFDESIVKPVNSINIMFNNNKLPKTIHNISNNIHGTSPIIEGLKEPDNLSQNNKSPTEEEIFTTSSSIESKFVALDNENQPLVSPIQLSTPVNIYKNIIKWASETLDNKCSKRGLANERLQRLKKYVNNSDKDNINTSNKVNNTADDNCKRKNQDNISSLWTATNKVNNTAEDNCKRKNQDNISSLYTATNKVNNTAEDNYKSKNQINTFSLCPATNKVNNTAEDNYKSKNQINTSSLCTATNKVNNTAEDNFKSKNQINISSLFTATNNVNNTAENNYKSKNRINTPLICTATNSKFFNSDNIDSTQISHVSPLLRGIKRTATCESIPDCSTPKKIAIDTKTNQFYKQPRSMRLVQSALCKENLNNKDVNAEKDKQEFATPVSIKKSVSKRTIKIKNNFSSSSKNKQCSNSDLRSASDFQLNDEEEKKHIASIEQHVDSDSYQEKMRMTAAWVVNHHFISNKQYEPFVDLPEIKKSPISNAATVESKEVFNEVEEMDWTNAEPDEETSKVDEENKKLDNNEKVFKESNNEKEDTNVEENNAVEVDKDPDKSKSLCIVVDTNIFIKNLSKLKDILDMKTAGPVQPILYIPWMVVTELDYIKDSSSSNEKLHKDVMNSIKFINTALKNKNERIVAQTVFDMQHQKQLGTSADDKIMSCCLFVKEKYKSVILLSNDLNLKNKAMINGIEACSSNEIIMKIMSKLTTNVKYQRIHHKMSILCSSIICDCAKETYGEVWKNMDMFKCPPWSLVECLKRFRKYWNTIFKDKLLKHFTKTLDETLVWLKHHKYFSDDSEEYIKFVKLCITLCIHLRDIEESSCAVQNTLNDITKLG